MKAKKTLAGSMAAYLRMTFPDPIKPKKRRKKRNPKVEVLRAIGREQTLGSQRPTRTKKKRRQMATESRRANRT